MSILDEVSHRNELGDLKPHYGVVEDTLSDGSTVFSVLVEVAGQRIRFECIDEHHADCLYVAIDGVHDINDS